MRLNHIRADGIEAVVPMTKPAREPSSVNKPRILIAEDEAHIREVLRMQLELEGFVVLEARDGQEGVELAERERPDVILLDVMMPRMDGYEACRRLRESFATRHIPIIMLTAMKDKEHRLQGLADGVNDFLNKPYDPKELYLRIRNALRWSQVQRAANPLTGLPGNLSINEETRRRLDEGRPFALLQIDIDFFKAYNDYYGYTRGDQAIQTVAGILVEAARHHGSDNFVGHIGGDDFVALTDPEHAEAIGEEIIESFGGAVGSLYDAEDRERGHIEVISRRNVPEQFPLMSLTIALVSTDQARVSHMAELADIAQELKARGKGIPGSVLVGERRRHAEAAPADPERHAA
jgi:PleD family two-component response regulator